MLDHRLSYWDEFYRSKEGSQAPSSFAVFIRRVIPHIDSLLDVGCGDGRDSLFFARSGANVVGIDGSATAIELCRKSSARDHTSAEFRVVHPEELLSADDRSHVSDKNAVIYSRFFLHAVEEEVEDRLLTAATASLHQDGFLCLEFRTIEDAAQPKVEKPHFRRFIDPSAVCAKAVSSGLILVHNEVGSGLATYGAEDPVVARLIFRGRER